MKFTNSPYETMMQQVPRYERPEPVKAPEGSRCHGCPYWDAAFTPARPSMRSFRMDGGRSP